MNTFLQRVHQLDTLAFLWVHVTKGFQYRHSVRIVSHTGDGPVYFLIALALFLLETTTGHMFFLGGYYCVRIPGKPLSAVKKPH